MNDGAVGPYTTSGGNFQMKLWNRFVKFLMVLGGFRWIVSEEGDVGFRWMGVEIYYYKHADLPLIYVHDDPPKYHEARRWEITSDDLKKIN